MANASIVFDLIGRDRASGDFEKVGKAADNTSGKMQKLGKLGRLAGLGLAAGLGAATIAAVGMVKAAAEDAAGQARLAKALRNATGATKSQVASVEDWISAQGKAFGVADDQLRPALEKLATATGDVSEAQKLAALGMDVSAGTGKSLEQVSTALAKAQNGNVSALSRLGISTKDAEGKTISFEEAQKRLAAAHGGQAANAANTLEGKMNRLKLALSETGEAIGAKLLPVATDLANWFLNEGLPKMEAFGAYLGEVLPPIFEKVKAVVSTVMGALKGDVGGNIEGIKAIFTDAISIIQSLWSVFGDNILGYLQSTFENLKTILSGAFEVVRGIFATFSALLQGDWSGVWDGIKQILSGATEIIKGSVDQLWNTIKAAFTSAGDAVKEAFSGLWSSLKTAAGNGISNIVNAVADIPGKLLNLGGEFVNAGKTLIGKLFDGFNKLGSIGTQLGENIFGAIVDALNSGIGFVNNAIPNSIGIGPASIDLPDSPIPKIALAKGGIVTRPTTALIGEAGPEAVIPLRGPNAPRSLSAGGDTVIVNNHFHGFVGNESQVAEEVEKAMIRLQRTTGRPMQFQTI